jgi:hypothetical protein
MINCIWVEVKVNPVKKREYTEAANKVGIAKKAPISIAPMMVAVDLEVPGIRARH